MKAYRIGRCVAASILLLAAARTNIRGQTAMPASDGVNVIVARALMLSRLNRKMEALITIKRALALAPTRVDIQQVRDLLEQAVHGREATAAINYEGWDDHREPLRESQLAFRQNTEFGPVIGRIAHLNRFGSRDNNVGLEAYPAFWGGYASVAVGYASTASLYPRTSFSAEISKELHGGFEGSFGYRQLTFSDAVHVFTGSIGKYYRDFLVGARLNEVRGGAAGASAVVSARWYFAGDDQYVQGQITTGSIREDIQTTADVVPLTSSTIGADGRVVLRGRWVLTPRLGLGRDERGGGGMALRTMGGAGLGIRF